MDSILDFAGTIIASIITVGGVIYSVRFYRKKVYIESITNERIRWITELKETVSSLMKFKNNVGLSTDDIREMNMLLSKILFYINGKDEWEIYSAIIQIQKELECKIWYLNILKIKDLLRYIELEFIFVFKAEWEIIKKESSEENGGKKIQKDKAKYCPLETESGIKEEYHFIGSDLEKYRIINYFIIVNNKDIKFDFNEEYEKLREKYIDK